LKARNNSLILWLYPGISLAGQTTGLDSIERYRRFCKQVCHLLKPRRMHNKKRSPLAQPQAQARRAFPAFFRRRTACYGASGISHSLANTHQVIMAIHNAIGKWVESPATPDKVLIALGKG
jgi:hypothetical protein